MSYWDYLMWIIVLTALRAYIRWRRLVTWPNMVACISAPTIITAMEKIFRQHDSVKQI